MVELQVTKQCSKCELHKEVSAFYCHKTKGYSNTTVCKSCHNQQRREKWAQNPDHYREQNRNYYARNSRKARNYDLKRMYGISLEQYNTMFAEQNGCCAICKRHQSLFKRAFAVDHDHVTSAVRKLLCHYCNTALGALQDNSVICAQAAEYLKEFKK